MNNKTKYKLVEDIRMDKNFPSTVIWFTGISGAGKTTIVNAISELLKEKGVQHQILDGDIVRDFFHNDLGYTRKERIFNVKRIAFAAHMLAQNGILVLVANIAPYYEVRDFIRERVQKYLQVFVRVDVATAQLRDVKGLYKKQMAGQMDNLIGVDDNYDIPRNPDLIVDTSSETIDESINKVVCLLEKNNLLGTNL